MRWTSQQLEVMACEPLCHAPEAKAQDRCDPMPLPSGASAGMALSPTGPWLNTSGSAGHSMEALLNLLNASIHVYPLSRTGASQRKSLPWWILNIFSLQDSSDTAAESVRNHGARRGDSLVWAMPVLCSAFSSGSRWTHGALRKRWLVHKRGQSSAPCPAPRLIRAIGKIRDR